MAVAIALCTTATAAAEESPVNRRHFSDIDLSLEISFKILINFFNYLPASNSTPI